MAVRDIERQIDKFMIDLDNVLTITHQMVGEKFVEKARNNVTQTIYSRQVYNTDGSPRKRRPWELTGNLRSSIGYSLLTPSNQIQGGFESGVGKKKGEQVASDVASKAKGDYKLVLVAGMDYAASVESKGYDVITQATKESEKILEKQVDKALKRLINRL